MTEEIKDSEIEGDLELTEEDTDNVVGGMRATSVRNLNKHTGPNSHVSPSAHVSPNTVKPV